MPTTFAVYQLILIAFSLVQTDSPTDFTDLGRKMLGGFVLAVIVAVTFTLLRLRWRDKNPPAKFISVVPGGGREEGTNAK